MRPHHQKHAPAPLSSITSAAQLLLVAVAVLVTVTPLGGDGLGGLISGDEGLMGLPLVAMAVLVTVTPPLGGDGLTYRGDGSWGWDYAPAAAAAQAPRGAGRR
jgi:hypothetical protein